MEKKWTESQLKVIRQRGKNLLVSAAAGSGKTAVLVERIIRMVTEGEDPADIDRLLVVTFTNAAAAEMRERIGMEIARKLEEQPGNAHLQRQQALLHNAQISTIHSFCLNVIRNDFHRIGIEPDFRVAEEGELRLLRGDVLARVLEEYYKDASPDFLALSETLDTGKDDKGLEAAVTRLFDFAMSNPWPEEWLEDCRKPFRALTLQDFDATPLAGELMGYLRNLAGQWARQLEICEEESLEEGGPYRYAEMLGQEAESMERLAHCATYREFSAAIGEISFGRLPRVGKDEADLAIKTQVQEMRKEVKDSVKKNREKFFYQAPEKMIEDVQRTRPVADMLLDVTLSFMRAFSEAKREKNIVDFSDQEHFALEILVDPATREPTAAAAEIRKGFVEIMVDEYQDSNYVQEAILQAVSKESEGEHNLFMVGDVKQSIYRFRMARPELFMEKSRSYREADGPGVRVDLHMNFRSRHEVIETVNDMFKRIMKEDIGNITYDNQAYLNPGASFPEPEGGEGFGTRFLLIEPAGQEDEPDGAAPARHMKNQELEAMAVGDEILRMMGRQQVTDQESGRLRPARYSDIAILLRSMKGWSDVFSSTLSRMGIPARAATGTGYFSSLEVQTALHMLRLIDNPRQDIPMAAVLSSPVVGLTEEEMAAVRAAFPDAPFYQAALRCAELSMGDAAGEEAASFPLSGPLRRKLRDFFKMLGKFRERARHSPIHELLSDLLDETGYAAYAYALPGGEVRRANLEMLVEKAISYESTSYRGLFHFIRYIEQLQKYDVDYAVADSGEEEDAVRIMSIHKSKGLEFPIVFVSGLGKRFNMQETRDAVVLHPKLGIGLDVVDCVRRVKSRGLMRQFLAQKLSLEALGEELRVLYVAMTRAKERLVLTGVMKDASDELHGDPAYPMEDGFLPFLQRQGARSFLQLLLQARSLQPEKYPLTLVRQEDLESRDVYAAAEEGLTREQLLSSLKVPDPEWDEAVDARLSFQYPYEAETAMRTKLSVSELKNRPMEQLPEEQEADRVDWAREGPGSARGAKEERGSYVPAFMRGGKESATGAQRGTATHRVLLCYDFTRDPDTLPAQVGQMVERHKIREEDARLVSLPGVERFLRSSLGERMSRAAAQGKLWKEKPFVIGKPAREVLKESDSGEMILVQGIIDAFFEEPDGIVLLDYKTDRVETREELACRYALQLDFYREAIERATGKRVKEELIYSFCLEEVISCGEEGALAPRPREGKA